MMNGLVALLDSGVLGWGIRKGDRGGLEWRSGWW